MSTKKKTEPKKTARQRVLDTLTMEDIVTVAHKHGARVEFEPSEPAQPCEPFAMLHVDGKPSPTVRHTDPDAASAEAQRLCLKEQRSVFVLVPVCRIDPLPQRLRFVHVNGISDMFRSNGEVKP
jgi:hypothetical protein